MRSSSDSKVEIDDNLLIQDIRYLFMTNFSIFMISNSLAQPYLMKLVNANDGEWLTCLSWECGRILLILLRMLRHENQENPVRKKIMQIKERSVLKKSSLSKTTFVNLQNSILHTITNHSYDRNAELAREVLSGIEKNSHLTDYLATLEEEIIQITQELAQLERTYQFAENLGQQKEVESFEMPSIQEREHRTGLLLSRLNEVLSVSRSYGSRELLKPVSSNMEGQAEPSISVIQRLPPLIFKHDY